MRLIFRVLFLLIALSAPAFSQIGIQTQPANQAFDLVRGGVQVRVSESYPVGPYKPQWAIAFGDGLDVRFALEFHAYRVDRNYDIRKIALADLQGVPVLVFAAGSGRCIANISPLPIVLSSTPQRFTLSNFRSLENPSYGCVEQMTLTQSWTGSLSLAANAQGDLTMDLNLQAHGVRGGVQYSLDARGVSIPNDHSTSWAIQQVVALQRQKAELAAQEAKRFEAALPLCVSRQAKGANIALLHQIERDCGDASNNLSARDYDALVAKYDTQIALFYFGLSQYDIEHFSFSSTTLVEAARKSVKYLLKNNYPSPVSLASLDELDQRIANRKTFAPDRTPMGLCMDSNAYADVPSRMEDSPEKAFEIYSRIAVACKETWRLHPLPIVTANLAQALFYVSESEYLLKRFPQEKSSLDEANAMYASAERLGWSHSADLQQLRSATATLYQQHEHPDNGNSAVLRDAQARRDAQAAETARRNAYILDQQQMLNH